ncbi:hypothetical protein CBS147346_6082 [Aspergillus niger]|nr:hypothetical protein CBS147346_6082 [Aspergillus niger]
MATPPKHFDITDAQDKPNPLSPPPLVTLPDLKGSAVSPTLWYRIHVLIFDLKDFGNTSSKKRLDKVTDPSYIGEPYFTIEEAEKIKQTIIDANGKTFSETLVEGLNERLKRRNKKRVQSDDFRVCAAHDLAPLMASALGIDLKQMEKDNDFARMVELKGLNLRGEIWSGLKKKSFSPKNKRR